MFCDSELVLTPPPHVGNVVRLDVNLSNLEFLLSWNNKMFYNIDNCSKILVVLSLAESRRGTQQ